MNAFSLAKDLANLERSWSSLDFWLNVWTFFVVVGVALELFVIVFEYVHEWKDFRRATIHSPEKPSKLVFLIGFFGTALVTLGVAGEFRVHVQAGKIETDIRSKSREMVDLARADAANAEIRISDANERSRTLEHSTQQLKTDAENARKQAEDERTARVRVEESLAGRRLSPEQQSKLADAVKVFGGEFGAPWFDAGDAEGRAFAWDIAKALNKGKWIVAAPASRIMMQGSGIPFDTAIEDSSEGVIVSSTGDVESTNAGKIMADELNRLGFDAEYRPNIQKGHGPAVSISVETRPQGPQGDSKLRARAPK